MPTFAERIALFRIQNYLAKYHPYVAASIGTYGRTVACQALYHAIAHARHVRMGFGVEQEKSMGLLKFLTRSKMQELTEIEPDTIMGEVMLERPGHLLYVTSRILPRLVVISHIGLEHVDLFGSKEMIAHEYAAVANTLSRDAVVVLNADDEYVRNLKEHISHPVITYGIHESADLRITRAKRGENTQGIFLEFILHNIHYEVYFPHLLVHQHVAGLMAGLAGAHAIGIDMRQAIAGVQQVQPPHGSFSISSGINSSSVIDDTADGCPEKLESSLKSLTSYKKNARTFIILGDFDNLAHINMRAHEALGTQAASAGNILIFVGDMMRHAQAAALKTGANVDTHHFLASAEAARWLPQHVRTGDIVYIAGGKNSEIEKVVKKLITSV